MDSIQDKYLIFCKNEHNTINSMDIMEHLPTFRKYAKDCDSIFETGVRGCVSSWAFVYGLLENETKTRKRLFLNDIDICDIDELISITRDFNIDVKYEWKNNLLLNVDEKYDITFIDTWHVYGQLKRELNKFAPITNKYIIMHDTTIDELYGETLRLGWDAHEQSNKSGIPVEEINKGLLPAIVEFLVSNDNWYIKERFTNNNGLMILARK